MVADVAPPERLCYTFPEGEAAPGPPLTGHRGGVTFVGTVVQFPPRQVDAAVKAEAILAKIGELYRRRTKAKEELPGVLAQLASAGETELVLEAVRLWGSGEMEADEVLALCQKGTPCRQPAVRGPLF